MFLFLFFLLGCADRLVQATARLLGGLTVLHVVVGLFTIHLLFLIFSPSMFLISRNQPFLLVNYQQTILLFWSDRNSLINLLKDSEFIDTAQCDQAT